MPASPPPAARAYAPDLLLAGGRVHAGAALTVRGGAVAEVGAPPAGVEVVRLPGQAIVPGLASAHGHAFQRAIRGRAQLRAAGRSDFWSWREAMYAVALRVGPDDLQAIARLLFLELARAGATCAGEFHYLHLDPEGRRYGDPDELARRVIAAAREVGLRVVLLRAAYARAGHGRPPDPAQRRFVEPTPEDAVAAVERLRRGHDRDPCVGFGLAPHSVRACPEGWIRALASAAARLALPLHVHAAEQPRELEECRTEHGLSPVELLDRAGALGPRATVVHGIHVGEGDVALLGRARATVCACPTTERDLGDGVVPADRLLAAGARLALGVDSCVEVDLLAEARALEGHLRLVRGARGVLAPGGGARDALALGLLHAAAAGGMASLGVGGGALAPGDPADFGAYDLADPALAGAGADDLAAHLVFSGPGRALRGLWVAGEPVLREGRAVRVDEEQVVREAAAALARVRAGA